MCNLSSGVLEKGKEIGRAEGRAERLRELIRSMLEENELPVEKIAKYAKVTVEEVRKIQAEMKAEV